MVFAYRGLLAKSLQTSLGTQGKCIGSSRKIAESAGIDLDSGQLDPGLTPCQDSSCACLFSPLHASFGSSMEKGGGHEQSQPYIHRAYNQRGSSSLFQVLTRQIPQENSDRLSLGHVSITNS